MWLILLKNEYAILDNGTVIVEGGPHDFSTQFGIGDQVTARIHRPFTVAVEVYGFIYALVDFNGECIYAILAHNGKKYFSNDVKAARAQIDSNKFEDYLRKYLPTARKE